MGINYTNYGFAKYYSKKFSNLYFEEMNFILLLFLFLVNFNNSIQQYINNPQFIYPQQQQNQQQQQLVYGPQLPQYYVQQQPQILPQSNQCSYMPDIDYYGNDLPGSPCPARSIEECCALCQNNPQCQAWTFVCDPNPDCSACFLKSCVGSDIRCVPNSKNFI